MTESEIIAKFRAGLEACHDAAAQGQALALEAGDKGKAKLARRIARRLAKVHAEFERDVAEVLDPGEIVAYIGGGK